MPWIEVWFPLWKDISKSIVFKVNPASVHPVTESEIFNEIAALQIFFEFVGLVFLISAVTYWLALRLTNRPPNPTLVQVHYWPTLVFAVFSFFLAHWVNRIPEAALHDPGTHALLVAFSWAFAAFFVFQLIFAIGGIRGMWRNKIPVSNSEIGP